MQLFHKPAKSISEPERRPHVDAGKKLVTIKCPVCGTEFDKEVDKEKYLVSIPSHQEDNGSQCAGTEQTVRIK
ncbi:MAG: hypothetical protein ABIF08_01050 [Nanoarchaeota archaeon]